MPDNKVITYNQLRNYFKNIVDSHKLLNPSNQPDKGHFYEFNEDFTGTGLKSPAFILWPDSKGIIDNKSDNVHLNNNFMFWIAMSGKKGDENINSEVLDKTFEIAWDVLTCIAEDAKNFRTVDGRFIHQFDPSLVDIDQFPPYGSDYFIGYSVKGAFANPKSLRKNPANFW